MIFFFFFILMIKSDFSENSLFFWLFKYHMLNCDTQACECIWCDIISVFTLN